MKCDDSDAYRRDFPIISAFTAAGIVIGITSLGHISYWALTLYYPLPHWAKVVMSITTVGLAVSVLLKYISSIDSNTVFK